MNALEDAGIQFSYDAFLKKKTFFHIGWWLRNIKTFIVDVSFPEGVSKTILVKKDFDTQWRQIEKTYKNELNNIHVIDELSNKEYEQIFHDSCIFLDLEDAVANNVVLECIRFHTPIMVRKNASVVEYLGEDYPLYFSHAEELSKLEWLSSSERFLEKIASTHRYLKCMDKNHLEPATFHRKLVYDLQKLQNTDNFFIKEPYLTWVCVHRGDISETNSLIQQFSKQENQEQLALVVFVGVVSEEYSFSPASENISFFPLDNYCSSPFEQILSTIHTKYVTFVKIHDEFSPNFSSLYIQYLDQHPTCDIGFSSMKIYHGFSETAREEFVLYEKDKQLFPQHVNGINRPLSSRYPIQFVYHRNLFSLGIPIKWDHSSPIENVWEWIRICICRYHLNVCCVSSNILSGIRV